jgi:DNA ligase 4
LIPQLDKERSTYGLKEQKLAAIYIKVLGMDPKSQDAIALHNYKDPNMNRGVGVAGDFTLKLQSLLRFRMPSNVQSLLSVQQVNEKLDELALASSSDEREQIIRYFFGNCTLIEQIWIVRIILKDLDLSMSELSILPLYHENAFKYFQVCADLKRLCIDLSDPTFKLERFAIHVFCPFAPQLSKRIDEHEKIPDEVGNNSFWIETKLDGERMQMHYQGGRFEWWSRNTKDYTSMYGGNWNEGSLVPKLEGVLTSQVQSCVLDGEMLAFNTESKSFEPFGSLKTASNEAVLLQENAVRHPCFVVFDIVYFNGQSLIDEPLTQRYQYLEKVLSKSTEYMQLLPHQIGNNLVDVMNALDERMEKGEEGLIIKNPNSIYVPNERQNSVKLKAEYISELSDDLDLVIVGGYFGQGRHRGGTLGSFLCAIRDDSNPEPHYISFCKFGSGFQIADLPKISLFEQGNWKRYSPDIELPWFTHVKGKENPDFYIEPQHSQVVQIRGSEIVPSVTFGAGYTLRFPRFVRLRPDKGYLDVMNKTELYQYIERNKGRMQRKRTISAVETPEKKKKARTTSFKVLPTHSGVLSNSIEATANIFDEKEFCVKVSVSKEAKEEIETLILTKGGKISQNPTKNTYLIVCDKPSIACLNRCSNQKPY